MITTVLWEDARARGRSFGPHELLVSCVADELERARFEVGRLLVGKPLKGVSKVRSELKQNVIRIRNSGPVFAVVDRDRVHDLWRQAANPPANCMTEITKQWKREAPGDYDLIFLVANVESLLDAVDQVLKNPKRTSKPGPDERDRTFQRCLGEAARTERDEVRNSCVSFDRLVKRVSASVPALR